MNSDSLEGFGPVGTNGPQCTDAKRLGDTPVNAWGEHGSVLGGITLRQHFAGLAMQGMLANTDKDDERLHESGDFMPIMAVNAVEAADALLAELSKDPN